MTDENKTTVVQAFENCAARRAAYQTAVISARGNIDDQFFAFHAAFSLLYNLALPNTDVMATRGTTQTLSHDIHGWIVGAKGWKDGGMGGHLFEMLVAALADAGLL